MSVNTSSPYKEKFHSIITEIFDKSKDMICDTDDILEYDATEITLLLKSIGFRLLSFEFSEPPNDKINDIEIEVRCRRSGLHSKLILQNNKCSCPLRKNANNNSFWEIHGISPSTPDTKSKGFVQDASCNLLPDIPKRSAKFSKTMLAVLLQNYQMNISASEDNKTKTLDVKQIVERFQLKTENNKNARDKSISPTDKPNPEIGKNTHCSTPLSSINDASIENIPKVSIMVSYEDAAENDTGNVKQVKNISADTQSRSSENGSLKENERTYDKLSAENENDICLIREIQEARKHLDSALLVLKCNVTKDMSRNSILTVTPQILKKRPPYSITKSISNRSSYLSATSNNNTPSSNSSRSNTLSSALRNNTPTMALRNNTPNSSLRSNRRHSTGSRLDPKNESQQKTQNPKLNDINNSSLKRRTIATPSSSMKSLESLKTNLDTKKLANKLLNHNSVQPVIKRTSTGTNLKSSLLGRAQITKSISKLSSLKDIKQ